MNTEKLESLIAEFKNKKPKSFYDYYYLNSDNELWVVPKYSLEEIFERLQDLLSLAEKQDTAGIYIDLGGRKLLESSLFLPFTVQKMTISKENNLPKVNIFCADNKLSWPETLNVRKQISDFLEIDEFQVVLNREEKR